MVEEKRYFIQNPAGAIHEVNKEQAGDLLRGVRGPGYRPATREQVKAYLTKIVDPAAGKPTQRWDRPIGERWAPIPEGIDVDDLFEEAGGVMEDGKISEDPGVPPAPPKKTTKKKDLETEAE